MCPKFVVAAVAVVIPKSRIYDGGQSDAELVELTSLNVVWCVVVQWRVDVT